jgi:hypothetical protein
VAVHTLPVGGKLSGHSSQQVRSQVRDFDVRENQKPQIGGDQTDVSSTGIRRPADIAIAAAQVSRRRREGQAGDRLILGRDEVFQMLANRLRVAQIVVLLDQAVEEPFARRPPYLLNVQRFNFPQPGAQRLALDLDRAGFAATSERIGWSHPARRQLDVSGAVECEHQAAADHVARLAVGLHPVPGLAELL